MQIYNIDATTGEFLGVSEARESPLEPGVYLIPAQATEVVPPDAEPGKAVCWRDDSWVQIEDHRGEHKWTPEGLEVVLTALGPVPAGLLDEKPAPLPPTPAEINSALDAQIKFLEAKQDRAIREIACDEGDVVDEQGKTPKQRIKALNIEIKALRTQRV